MSQIVERFADAVQALVGEGPIKNRLNKAYSVYLADLQQIELPVASKHAFGRLHSALHSGAAIGRADSVTASVQKMSPEQAWRHAQTIVQVYSELLTLEHNVRSKLEVAAEPMAAAEPTSNAAPNLAASGR